MNYSKKCYTFGMNKELNISYAIKNLLLRLNWSPFDMASYLGKSERHIWNYISNHENPNKETFIKICDLIDKSNIDIFELLDLEPDDGFLFHGSENGIVGQISTRKNMSNYNDFGNGFYLSDSLRNAITYVVECDNPIIYRIKSDSVINSKVYDFSKDKVEDDNWVLFIGLNRGKITDLFDKSFFQKHYDDMFSKYDVLVGEIADSYNFDVLDSFFAGIGGIKQVKTALSLANIGPQYVVKSESLANSLLPVESYTLEKRFRKYLLQLKRNKRDKLKAIYNVPISVAKDENDFTFDEIKNMMKKKYE